jgi:hypothetical protein
MLKMKSGDLLNIVLSPVDCTRGAPMGRSNHGEKPEGKRKVCRKIDLHDGDYDKGGAYWGYVPGHPLYVEYDDSLDYIRFFRR